MTETRKADDLADVLTRAREYTIYHRYQRHITNTPLHELESDAVRLLELARLVTAWREAYEAGLWLRSTSRADTDRPTIEAKQRLYSTDTDTDHDHQRRDGRMTMLTPEEREERDDNGELAQVWSEYDDQVAARVAAFLRGDDMRVAHHHTRMLALRSVLVGSARGGTAPVSAADLIAAGRKVAPDVLCYCGRSGYNSKCPMHGKPANRGGAADV